MPLPRQLRDHRLIMCFATLELAAMAFNVKLAKSAIIMGFPIRRGLRRPALP